MRFIALMLVVVVASTVTAASAPAQVFSKTSVQSSKWAVCTTSVVQSQKKGQLTFAGKCKLGKKVVPSLLHFAYKTLDEYNYTCAVRSGATRGKTLTVSPSNGFSWAGFATYMPKNKKLKFKGHRASFKAALGGEVMCGKPGDKNPQTGRVPTIKGICSWALPPSDPACGTTYWMHDAKPRPVPVWDFQPSFRNGAVSIGHFVSPGGFCKAIPYKDNFPPDSWYHVVNWSAWQCGELAVETTFTAAFRNINGEQCRLPDSTAGEGVMALQVSQKWGGTLLIQARILASTGKIGYDSVGVAYEYTNAYIPLPGNEDGCQDPRVTGSPTTTTG